MKDPEQSLLIHLTSQASHSPSPLTNQLSTIISYRPWVINQYLEAIHHQADPLAPKLASNNHHYSPSLTIQQPAINQLFLASLSILNHHENQLPASLTAVKHHSSPVARRWPQVINHHSSSSPLPTRRRRGEQRISEVSWQVASTSG